MHVGNPSDWKFSSYFNISMESENYLWFVDANDFKIWSSKSRNENIGNAKTLAQPYVFYCLQNKGWELRRCWKPDVTSTIKKLGVTFAALRKKEPARCFLLGWLSYKAKTSHKVNCIKSKWVHLKDLILPCWWANVIKGVAVVIGSRSRPPRVAGVGRSRREPRVQQQLS